MPNPKELSFNSKLLNDKNYNNYNTFRHYSSLIKKNNNNNNSNVNISSNMQNNPFKILYTNTEINNSNNNFCSCIKNKNTINSINSNFSNHNKILQQTPSKKFVTNYKMYHINKKKFNNRIISANTLKHRFISNLINKNVNTNSEYSKKENEVYLNNYIDKSIDESKKQRINSTKGFLRKIDFELNQLLLNEKRNKKKSLTIRRHRNHNHNHNMNLNFNQNNNNYVFDYSTNDIKDKDYLQKRLFNSITYRDKITNTADEDIRNLYANYAYNTYSLNNAKRANNMSNANNTNNTFKTYNVNNDTDREEKKNYFLSMINNITRKVEFVNTKNNLLSDEKTMNLLNIEEYVLNSKLSNILSDNYTIKKFSKSIFDEKNGNKYLLPLFNVKLINYHNTKKKYKNKNENKFSDDHFNKFKLSTDISDSINSKEFNKRIVQVYSKNRLIEKSNSKIRVVFFPSKVDIMKSQYPKKKINLSHNDKNIKKHAYHKRKHNDFLITNQKINLNEPKTFLKNKNENLNFLIQNSNNNNNIANKNGNSNKNAKIEEKKVNIINNFNNINKVKLIKDLVAKKKEKLNNISERKKNTINDVKDIKEDNIDNKINKNKPIKVDNKSKMNKNDKNNDKPNKEKIKDKIENLKKYINKNNFSGRSRDKNDDIKKLLQKNNGMYFKRFEVKKKNVSVSEDEDDDDDEDDENSLSLENLNLEEINEDISDSSSSLDIEKEQEIIEQLKNSSMGENNISNMLILKQNIEKEEKKLLMKIEKKKNKTLKLLFQYIKHNLKDIIRKENIKELLKQQEFRDNIDALKSQIMKSRELSNKNKSKNLKSVTDDDIINYLYKEITKNEPNFSLIQIIPRKNNYTAKLRLKSNKKLDTYNKNQELIDENEKIDGNIKKEREKEKEKLKIMVNEMALANELRFHIQETNNKELRERFQKILAQIESYQNLSMAEYVEAIKHNYLILKEEMNQVLNDKEMEERINGFITNLDIERNILESKWNFLNDKINIKDNKFHSYMEKFYNKINDD